MPDIHQGYGFPVGGVAATEAPDGVVSPGGVGYDINCGVRLLALPLSEPELGDRRERLVHEISRAIPAGTGRKGELHLGTGELRRLLAQGPRMLVDELGIGTEDDVEHTESGGCLPGADADAVSERALDRGRGQIGTVGSGNHFVELQRVERIFDPATAEVFGLNEGQLTVLIHSGSRGLGHQVCTDYVHADGRRAARYGIDASRPAAGMRTAVLAGGPLVPRRRWRPRPTSPGRTGRRWRTRVRESVRCVLGGSAAEGTRQVYDVAHNVAKLERHGGRSVLRPSQGRDPCVPRRLGRDSGGLSRRRPAGLHPGQHGHGELRARRRARIHGALVRHDLPRRRQAAQPHQRAQAGHGRAAPARARASRGSSSAARRTRASPRRRLSPTRTWSASSASSSGRASPAASHSSVPLGVVKG